MDELFQQGINFFNTGYYFEAHDVFEEIWMDTRGQEKRFYQGLVQLSTGFYHLRMNNCKGALSQLDKGLAKLKPFRPSCNGLELSATLEKVDNCVQIIEKKSKEAFSFDSFKSYIPRLELEHER